MRLHWLIAIHFWKNAFTNRAVTFLFVFVGICALYAALTGWANAETQQTIRHKYQQEARQDWLNNPDKHPHRMAHYGHFAFRTKAPLSLFDFGTEPFLGNAIFLEAHKQNAVNFSEAGFSTGLLRFGQISLATVLQLLFPLLIFFLGFGSIAADRENGTLRLLLTQGVSWKGLMVGNSLGLLAVIMTLFVPIMFLTGVLGWVVQGGRITLDEAGRLGLLTVFYFFYLVIFCVIAVLVSAYSQTAKSALVTLVGLWLMLTLVVPRASQALGSALFPAPSKARFQAAIHDDIARAGDSHNPDDPHYKTLKDSLLTAYGVSSVQQLPFNYSGFVMAEGEKISAAIYNNHFGALQSRFRDQNRFARTLAFLNPYLAIKNLSMALSGTDYAGYVDFQQQAEDYRYAMAQHLNELQIRYVSNQKLGPTDKPYAIDRKHWKEVPDFRYTPRPISAVFGSEAVSVLAFGFWLILLLVLVQGLSKTVKAI